MPCLYCGGLVPEFRTSGRQKRERKDKRFCSRKCWRLHAATPSVVQARFWAMVNRKGAIHPVCGQCWEWTGVTGRGYGKFRSKPHGESKTQEQAHRYSWRIVNGEIPDDLDVLHRCDNRRCVNPLHLFLGTHQDNMDDRSAKGRQAKLKGEAASKAILTDDQVREIRRRYVRRRRDPINGAVALGREFGVAYSTIIAVVKRTNWSHVE